jgi:hypothetical protein
VTPSIGSLDGRVLLLWNDVVNDPVLATDPLSMRFRRYAQWFDETGTISPPQDLGPSMGYFESWVHDGDELVAQSWGDPEDRVPQVAEDRRVFLLRADAGADLRWTSGIVSWGLWHVQPALGCLCRGWMPQPDMA